jgi:hypothetical protein
MGLFLGVLAVCFSYLTLYQIRLFFVCLLRLMLVGFVGFGVDVGGVGFVLVLVLLLFLFGVCLINTSLCFKQRHS